MRSCVILFHLQSARCKKTYPKCFKALCKINLPRSRRAMSNFKISSSNLVFRCQYRLLPYSVRFLTSFGPRLRNSKKRELTKTTLKLFRATKLLLRWITIWFAQWTKLWLTKKQKTKLWEHSTVWISIECRLQLWMERTSRASKTTKVNCSKHKSLINRFSRSTRLTNKGLHSSANPEVIWPPWSQYLTLV